MGIWFFLNGKLCASVRQHGLRRIPKKVISCACGGIGNVRFTHSSGKAAAVAFVKQIALRLSGQIRSHAACPPTWTPAHTQKSNIMRLWWNWQTR